MIGSFLLRLQRVGVKGFLNILEALAVVFATLLARFVLLFIPQRLLSLWDFERSQHVFKGWVPSLLILSRLNPVS
jgi:hypothetical protein